VRSPLRTSDSQRSRLSPKRAIGISPLQSAQVTRNFPRGFLIPRRSAGRNVRSAIARVSPPERCSSRQPKHPLARPRARRRRIRYPADLRSAWIGYELARGRESQTDSPRVSTKLVIFPPAEGRALPFLAGANESPFTTRSGNARQVRGVGVALELLPGLNNFAG